MRERDWQAKGDDSFSHDLKRHRRTTTALPERAQTLTFDPDLEPNAVVISHAKKWATVERDGEELLCRIDEGLTEGQSTLLAPGDSVRVEPRDGEPWIVGVRPRRSRLSRLAIEHSRVDEQVIAANVDLLVIVSTPLEPAFKPGLVDRFLICADRGGVEPVLCMNKVDLAETLPEEVEVFREIGIDVLVTSCESRRGIDALREKLRGKTSVFAGQSGVGKTSLLNALDTSLDLATQSVSRANEKGRHTTTGARLFHLDGGIDVIDTPGIRKMGLWDIDERELIHFFPELAEIAQSCKFRDCTHGQEPNCAVRAAIESGELPLRRFGSYLRIREDLRERAEYPR